MSDPTEELRRLGIEMEPDSQHRDTVFHKFIVKIKPIPNTRTGHWLELECGHVVMTFGRLEMLDGVCLCQECRKAAA
jgi:hypothetical protein